MGLFLVPGGEGVPQLFKPIRIGNLLIPNRIKYAATEDNFNEHQGFITDADDKIETLKAIPRG